MTNLRKSTMTIKISESHATWYFLFSLCSYCMPLRALKSRDILNLSSKIEWPLTMHPENGIKNHPLLPCPLAIKASFLIELSKNSNCKFRTTKNGCGRHLFPQSTGSTWPTSKMSLPYEYLVCFLLPKQIWS